MTNEIFIEAVNAVGAELRSLSREEFARELKRHEGGDIAQILMETNAMCLRDAVKEDNAGS